MTEADEERLAELEIQLAHQGRSIEELSDMVSKQWEMIDRMSRQIRSLKDALVELEDNSAPAANQKPPHY